MSGKWTGQKIERLRREVGGGFAGEAFDVATGERSESPIERLFMSSILAQGWQLAEGFLRAHSLALFQLDEKDSVTRIWTDPESGVAVAQQLPIRGCDRRYRIDFAFGGSYCPVAVELDGHQFHERTREQAARDRARDRALIRLGWTVIRFTGGEVFDDAIACVDECARVAQAVDARWQDAFDGGWEYRCPS